jgi:hypothetical protein
VQSTYSDFFIPSLDGLCIGSNEAINGETEGFHAQVPTGDFDVQIASEPDEQQLEISALGEIN